jgi:hypothetical protein
MLVAKQIRKATAITGAEVVAWTGLDNHFRQNTEMKRRFT